MAARRRPAVDGSKAPENLRPVCRNVTVAGRRTSVRMEPLLWESLNDICRREERPVSDVVTLIDARRGDSALTAALRVFILAYYREASRSRAPLMVPAGLAEEQAALSTTFEDAMRVFAPSD